MTPESDDAVAVVRDAYDLHYGSIVAWTDRLLLDTDLAHEVVTEAFARLLRQHKSPDDARPTLYAHVVRAVLEHWQHESGERLRSGAEPGTTGPGSTHSARSLGLALPERLRETFLLRWYAALTVPEIVAVTSSTSRGVARDLAEAATLLEPADGGLTDQELTEIFAAERASVRPVPGGPDHWEQIAHQAQQQRRSWFWPLAAVLAVVALALSAWSVQQNPFGNPGVESGNRVDGATASARAGDGGPPLERSGPQSPRSVPGTFVPWSLSNAGSGTLFSLGSSRCAAEEVCPTLTRSTDNGSSWTALHVFGHSDTASVTSDDVPRIQPSGAITEVQFADPKVGFAFGGSLWRTTDGGRSFTEFPHPGDTVLDVAVSQGEVIVLTADGCTQGRCVGPLMVSRAKVGATRINQPVTALELAEDRPIDSGTLVLSDGDIFVQPYRVDGNLDPPWRLEDEELIPMRSGSTCGNNPLQAMTSTANGTPALYALCGGDLRGNVAEYQLVRSTDGGKDWRPASRASVQLPRIGRLSLTAIDHRRLVVAAGGPRKVAGPTRVENRGRLLQVTENAGATWKPASDPLPPPQGIDWVDSVGGAEVYAITRSTSSFWRSTDNGKAWKPIDPTRVERTPSSPPPSTSTR